MKLRNEVKELHWTYYIPLYLVFISLLLLSSRDFQSAQSTPITLSNLHRVGSILLEILLIVLYFIKKQKIKRIPLPLVSYGIFITIGIISAIIYSPSLLYDLWKLTELIALFLLGVYIWSVSNKDFRVMLSFFEKIILYIKFLLITVIISILTDPSHALQLLQFGGDTIFPFRVQGTIIIINALSVGTLSAIIFFHSSINSIYDVNKKFISLNTMWIIVSFVLLILSQSRTSIFGILIAFMIYFLLIKKMNLYKKFFLLVISSSLIIGIFPYFLSFIQRGSSGEVIGSLSGRTAWWQYAWEKFLNGSLFEQLVGFGFASGERQTANDSSGGVMNTLDSTYVSSLISTGLLGTGILIMLIIYINYSLFKKARRNKKNFVYVQLFGFMTIITLKTLTTGTVNILTYYSLFFIILIILASAKIQTKATT